MRGEPQRSHYCALPGCIHPDPEVIKGFLSVPVLPFSTSGLFLGFVFIPETRGQQLAKRHQQQQQTGLNTGLAMFRLFQNQVRSSQTCTIKHTNKQHAHVVVSWAYIVLQQKQAANHQISDVSPTPPPFPGKSFK